MNLEAKTALIVGASRGIGRAVAELFAHADANVAVVSRSQPELMELEYKLNTNGYPNVLAIDADAESESDMQRVVNQTRERFGSIDYLIHTAGAGILKPFTELKLTDLDFLLGANLRTAFNVFQAVLPIMQEQKFGRVVAFPGILGKAPMMQASVYCAAKYGLSGMVKCLAQEYKRFGIRFTLMHLGGVDSDFWNNITMKVQRDKMLTVEVAAEAAFFAVTQPGEGVMAEIVLMPENHQLV
jgi:NAD(P)-dependent dehydrogenase (short-subunit alcohol dehydrogenase family)